MWFRSVAVALVLVWSAGGAAASEDAAFAEFRPPRLEALDVGSLDRALDGSLDGAPGAERVRAIADVADPNLSLGDAEPGSGGSEPRALVAYMTPNGARLEWLPPEGGEPDTYRVYRSVDGAEAVLLAEVPETTYTDPDALRNDPHAFVYHVTAVYDGDPPAESGPSNPALVVTGTSGCWLVHVDPDLHPEPDPDPAPGPYPVPVPDLHVPDPDVYPNERFLECLLAGRVWG